jgi:alcohol dehydrogenase
MLATYIENGAVTIRDVPKPVRLDGFALIRLIYAGICNTDLELQRGYYGFAGIPGHEFVGEVVEADTMALVGKRVAGEINLNCTQCDWCLKGLGNHCPHRTVLGIVKHPGAFAEFVTLPERNLHLVPDSITNEQAVFTEPLAAARRILDQVDIGTGEGVAVLGQGKLGTLIARVLKANDIRVDAYGRHDEKPAHAYNWVVDATGSAAGLQQAAHMTRPRGTLILKSTVHGLAPVDTAEVVVNELTMIGSRCGRFEPALELLASGQVEVHDMISEVLPLEKAPHAFERAAQKGVLKVLLSA